jgi:signal peptidase I
MRIFMADIQQIPEVQQKANTWQTELWDLLKTILIFAVIYFVVKTFIAQPFLVKGRSMEQTFSDGDYLIVDELSYRFRDPQRFEVIVFHTEFIPGGAQREYYIKRVIGLPGDRVVIEDGKVTIYEKNGDVPTKLDEPYILDGVKTLSPEPIDIILEPNKYFVLGDNRGNSSDSRYWGVLDKSYIVGKPAIRLFPFNAVTVFSKERFIESN